MQTSASIFKANRTLLLSVCLLLPTILMGCAGQEDDRERSEVIATSESLDSTERMTTGVSVHEPDNSLVPMDMPNHPFQQPPPEAMIAPAPMQANDWADAPAVNSTQAMRQPRSVPGEHLSHLPAGSEHHQELGFATVQVFYATDRKRSELPLSAYDVGGQKQVFVALAAISVGLLLFSMASHLQGRSRVASFSLATGFATSLLAAAFISLGQASIEKHGVTYTGDRGTLVRGVCEVSVPDTHQRGEVERPSLLRFEIHEDQQKHVVLTSAVELAKNDFQQRLSDTVAQSPDRDLLVFIHGYNVGFESAVQRTAQIAVDLPFEGVPVCYSWPSQASLFGYTVDENNAEWTIAHLKQFLLELADESGADSINVVAHSMGNRAMTAAMQQIRWHLDEQTPPPFDRIVLAAPDVDADRFRRDLAPSLLKVSRQVTLYASSSDQALIASKKVHGYPRAGESGPNLVVVPGVETVDVSGIDLTLLGHSYYGDNESMLRDLHELVRIGLPAAKRQWLVTRGEGERTYWQLSQSPQPPTAGGIHR